MEGETRAVALSSPSSSMRESLAFWTKFVDKCIRERLDVDHFKTLVRLCYDQHQLPAPAIADLFLRPQPNNCYSLDPRVPPYLSVLGDLGYVDAPAILRALYKYSSSHKLVESPQNGANDEDGEDGSGSPEGNKADKKKKEKKTLHWKSSYWVEEVVFFRLCRQVHEGQAVQDTATALEVIKIVSKWLALFTAAPTAFATDLMSPTHNLQMEMESARAAFVPLLLRLTDNPSVLKVIRKPIAKGMPAAPHVQVFFWMECVY